MSQPGGDVARAAARGRSQDRRRAAGAVTGRCRRGRASSQRAARAEWPAPAGPSRSAIQLRISSGKVVRDDAGAVECRSARPAIRRPVDSDEPRLRSVIAGASRHRTTSGSRRRDQRSMTASAQPPPASHRWRRGRTPSRASSSSRCQSAISGSNTSTRSPRRTSGDAKASARVR